MRIHLYLAIILLIYASAPTIIYMVDNGDNGLHVSIRLDTPIPGNTSYRGYNASATLSIHNGYGEPVNISIKLYIEPLQLVWSNYTPVTLNPGADTWFTWIIHVPEDISFGNYTLGFNITYTINSSTYSIYREAWITVIPRNISLITADLYRNNTSYILVIINPLMDPGQYIIENISVTIEPFNISVDPTEAFIDKLYANNSYRIPMAINFNESDIGVLAVNITAYDDVHGLVYFNYTFIVVNASAHLHLCLVNDYGRTLPEAFVVIDNETYSTGPDGCLNLVLPIGFHNYTILYRGHRVSGKLILYTGYNNYTLTIDLNPPTIVSVEQKGFGVYIKAFDPGERSTGISSIVFIQDGNEWRYTFYPRRNVSFILYPPLASGETTIVVADMQGNKATIMIQYVKPEIGYNAWETILVLAITSTVLVALLIITRGIE